MAVNPPLAGSDFAHLPSKLSLLVQRTERHYAFRVVFRPHWWFEAQLNRPAQ